MIDDKREHYLNKSIRVLKSMFFYFIPALFLPICMSGQQELEIQKVLDEYYNTISGRVGEKRDFEALLNLFHPKAQLVYTYWQDDQLLTLFMSPEEYIEKLDYLDKVGFMEKELSNKISFFGSISQVFSIYEFESEDNSINGRGVTGYDIIFNGDSYKIIGMYWTMEDDNYKLPYH